MRKSRIAMDKFSLPQNNPLVVAKQIYQSFTKKEIHLDELILRVSRKRKSSMNVSDEARIIQAIGLLIAIGKLDYYKGFVFKK